MKPYVITVSRQFASMGHAIAKNVARILDIDFYDRDVVEEAAKRTGLSASSIGRTDETAPSHSIFLQKKNVYNLGAYSISQQIFDIEKNIILDFAEKSSCVIVGRCADYILRDRENVLRVYIYAPYATRFKNCTEYLQMTRKEAEIQIRNVDLARSNYRKLHCPECVTEFDERDLMIDSSKFGIEGSALVIIDALKHTIKSQSS